MNSSPVRNLPGNAGGSPGSAQRDSISIMHPRETSVERSAGNAASPGTIAAPPGRDRLLFTPGPLTTSLGVKQAMLHDAGSWHFEFNDLVGSVRRRLLAIA